MLLDVLLIAASVAFGIPIAIRAWRALRLRTWSIDLLVTIAIIGGIAIGTWGGLKSRITTAGLAIAACGVIGILLGVPINFVLYLVWMFLCGVVIPAFNTPAITALHSAPPIQ